MLSAPLPAAAAMPVMWDVLGYSFPAGSMIVGLLAAVMARAFITLSSRQRTSKMLDFVVTGIVLLATAVWIAERQPHLLGALGTGFGCGAVGAGIISFFEARARAALAAFTGQAAAPSGGIEPREDDRDAADAALRALDQHP